MGVPAMFRFRRLFRRERRVVDGNRHLVVGHEGIPQGDAKSSPPPPQQFPKGSHFLVKYDRNQLSASELDICNNNDNGDGGSVSVIQRNGGGRQEDGQSVVVFTTMGPGGAAQRFEQRSFQEHVGGGGDDGGRSSSETVAVLPTTDEWQEVDLFEQ